MMLDAGPPPVAKAAFVAYGAGEVGKQQKQKFTTRGFKLGLVAFDCVLLGLQPVFIHMSKNKDGKYSFDPVSVNFCTEVLKTSIAFVMLLALGTGRPGVPLYLSFRSFIRDMRHNSLLAVPAALYAVNNYLKFALQLFFRPTSAKMLSNLKIFAIAMLMRAVLKRKFSVLQWEALFLLVAGITVNQLHGGCSGAAASFTGAALASMLVCTSLSVTVPACASVFNEMALKRHMDTSVHLQNFFLYFFGCFFNLIGLLIVCLAKQQSPMATIFTGQSRVTLLLMLNNAGQGILASFFFKFADTILKKYSSTIATIFTAIMSYVLFAHDLTANFIVGVSIVFVSMHQFFSFGDKKGAAGGKDYGQKTGAELGAGSNGHSGNGYSDYNSGKDRLPR